MVPMYWKAGPDCLSCRNKSSSATKCELHACGGQHLEAVQLAWFDADGAQGHGQGLCQVDREGCWDGRAEAQDRAGGLACLQVAGNPIRLLLVLLGL